MLNPKRLKVCPTIQTSFSSIEDCETGRTKVLEDAQRLNPRVKWTSIYGEGAPAVAMAATNDVSVSAVCVGSNRDADMSTYKGTRPQVLAHEAYRWALVAAELGDPEAQARLGTDLIAAPELKWMADTVEGLKWLNRSAQHGCFDAFFYLSMVYRDGVNFPDRPHGYVPQNSVEAFKWLNLAISRKDVKQCNMFFDFYHGGPRNPADANRDPLREYYDGLAGKLTPAQVAEGQKLAGDWKPTDPVNRQAWDRNEVTSRTREQP